MIKRIIPAALLGAAIFGASSCKNDSFKKVNGVEYMIIKEVKGKKPAMGDVVEVNYKLIADSVVAATGKTETFTVIDTRKQNMGKPVPVPIDDKNFKGDIREVIKLLSPGDSVLINVPIDTLMVANPGKLPPWMKKGHKITFQMTIANITTMEQYQKDMQAKQEEMKASMQKDMQAKAAEQTPIDEKILQDYFTKNNLKPSKTPGGVYYIIHKEGTGATIKPGQTASIRYTGKTLDGKMFDSNVDPSKGHTDAFSFPVGEARVIPGWDDGVQVMKKGTKATLYIPSPLAYGERGAGADIAPNSILMFDMEVVNVEDKPAK